MARAHRLGAVDVLLHDGPEDRGLALVEHGGGLQLGPRSPTAGPPGLALDDTECLARAVGRATGAPRRSGAGPRPARWRGRRSGRGSPPGPRRTGRRRRTTARAGPRPRGSPARAPNGGCSGRPGRTSCDCATGLKTRKYGAGSVPVPAVHCQPCWFDATSPSTRCCMNHRAPRVQSTWRSFTRKLATIMRTRLCIQPSACSWRIPASTIGYPVLPRAPGLEALVGLLARVDPHLPHRRVERRGAPCRGGGGARRRRTPASTARWRRPARPCPRPRRSGSAAGAGSPTSGTATGGTCCRGPGDRARRRSRARVRRGTRRAGAGGPPLPRRRAARRRSSADRGRPIGRRRRSAHADARGRRTRGSQPWARHALENGVNTLKLSPPLFMTSPGRHGVGRTDPAQLAPVLLERPLHVLVALARRTDRSPPRSTPRSAPTSRASARTLVAGGPVRITSRPSVASCSVAQAPVQERRAGWARPACAGGRRARRAAPPRRAPRSASTSAGLSARRRSRRNHITARIARHRRQPTQAACQSVTACASSTSRENGAPVTARPKLPPLPSDAVQRHLPDDEHRRPERLPGRRRTNVKVQSLVASHAYGDAEAGAALRRRHGGSRWSRRAGP